MDIWSFFSLPNVHYAVINIYTLHKSVIIACLADYFRFYNTSVCDVRPYGDFPKALNTSCAV